LPGLSHTVSRRGKPFHHGTLTGLLRRPAAITVGKMGASRTLDDHAGPGALDDGARLRHADVSDLVRLLVRSCSISVALVWLLRLPPGDG